jgi:hypothetical protein
MEYSQFQLHFSTLRTESRYYDAENCCSRTGKKPKQRITHRKTKKKPKFLFLILEKNKIFFSSDHDRKSGEVALLLHIPSRQEVSEPRPNWGVALGRLVF